MTETAREKEEPKVTDPVVVSNNDEESLIEADITKKVQRRVKRETHLYAGCGFSKKKKQLLQAFWGIMWKELERIGWRKLVGEDEEEGSITFFTPTSSENDKHKPLQTLKTEGKRGKDFYDRIKDVIDRVLECRNTEEKNISDLFKAKYSIENHKKPMGRQSGGAPGILISSSTSRPRRTATSSTASGSTSTEEIPVKKRERPSLSGAGGVDLSWKDGGSLYPKRSSQVGDEFQATDIPPAGTYTKGAHSELYELIWDPQASRNGLEKILEEKIPYNKKEQALTVLGLMGLNEREDCTPNVTEIVSHLNPVDGSDWTEEEKAKFYDEIFRLRKDITALSKSMGKDIKSCLTFYLGSYKKSDDYRLLKTVCTDERNDKAELNIHGVDACAICGDGGSLLICDGCEGEYHMGCLRPRLSTVPEGHWECDECVDKSLLKAREYIIANSKLYEPMRKNGRKRKPEKISKDGSSTDDEMMSDGMILRPSSPVMAEIKKFTRLIDAVFCPTVDGASKTQANVVT